MTSVDVGVLRGRLADSRGGRVVFVSHCILNQNVRYLGGATRPGPVPELVDLLESAGVGVVQLACPEEQAWGGVLKPRLLAAYGARRRWWFRYRRPLLRLGMAWTRHVYRRLAGRLVRQIRDYQRAGMEVVAVVGVGASPSCGVLSTLDVGAALDALADVAPQRLERDAFNRDVIADHVVTGAGLFIRELTARLHRHGMDVPLVEHDLLDELAGGTSTALAELRRLLGPAGWR